VPGGGGVNGLPSGPRHCAASPGAIAHRLAEPWPIALTKRAKVPRAVSVERIEKGRRSGGSALRPALIITNWPGRASRAVSGWRKPSRKYGPPRASRSTSDATRLAGMRGA
jgi:hypothetical protein